MREDFAPRLKAVLYEAHELPPRTALLHSTTNTLAVLARVIAREARSPRRRIVRIITLNVDDLLERAIEAIAGTPVPVISIVRGGLNAPRSAADVALPIYHLHGYPRSGACRPAGGAVDPTQEAADVLVFTDLQYWASAAIPSSHMNRTFSFALHDSHCVFIGTSMLDLNIWRWLAMRAFEIGADCKSLREANRPCPKRSCGSATMRLSRGTTGSPRRKRPVPNFSARAWRCEVCAPCASRAGATRPSIASWRRAFRSSPGHLLNHG